MLFQNSFLHFIGNISDGDNFLYLERIKFFGILSYYQKPTHINCRDLTRKLDSPI